MDHEYAPISGVGEFTKASINLALGDNNEFSSNGLVGTFTAFNLCTLLHYASLTFEYNKDSFSF